MEWVSVKDRMPEEGVSVIIWDKQSVIPQIGSYMGNETGEELFSGYTECYVYVTHWMPLPEPPKEDQ